MKTIGTGRVQKIDPSAVGPERVRLTKLQPINVISKSFSTERAAILTAARAAARSVPTLRKSGTKFEKAEKSLSLLSKMVPSKPLAVLCDLIGNLPIDERHYWVGTFYTLLLSPKIRRRQATYFTPPFLADAVLDLIIRAGADLKVAKILDPAAGGAAFLSTIVARRLESGMSDTEVLRGLKGYEIDSGLAKVSRELIQDRIKSLRVGGGLISTCDALAVRPREQYDLVIANPPYGRISADDLRQDQWVNISHSSHINKYAVFVDLAVRSTRRGGIIALVLPSSFRSGPLYDRMRTYLRAKSEVVAVASVPGRDKVFADVAQDVSVLILRKGEAHAPKSFVQFPTIGLGGVQLNIPSQLLPSDPASPWPLPAEGDDDYGGATLAQYGVEIKAGYFVWNRQRQRLSEKSVKSSFPLIWAKNIRPGTLCIPAGKNGLKADFVVFDGESQAIIRGYAAVMQRTTNDKQPRRLVAAMVDRSVVKRWGGFVTENHTIVLVGSTLHNLRLAVRLLNTKAVDKRYRRVSGTAAVSVKLLRKLDLPSPERFIQALNAKDNDAELAATAAYSKSKLLMVGV